MSKIRTVLITNKKPIFLGVLFVVILFIYLMWPPPPSPPPPPPPSKTPTATSSPPTETKKSQPSHTTAPPLTTTTTTTTPTVTFSPPNTSSPTPTRYPIEIIIDDFNIPPYPGESVYPFNRLQGNRGIVNGSVLEGGNGVITTTIASGNSWGGAWMSLNHPLEEGIPINFSQILPKQIRSEYQSQISGISIQVAEGTPNRILKIELKHDDEVRWVNEVILTGGTQELNFELQELGEISQLVWILDRGAGEDYVVLDSVTLTATTPISDTGTAAFVWSYGMLLNNWNPETGLVRDKSRDPSGKFDGIQVTGSLAAATAMAYQLGIIEHQDAIQIIEKIGITLLNNVPTYKGLWPHWMQVLSDGKINIVNGTEWSSVDTAIAAIGLLTAQSSLGLDTSGTENMIQSIVWDDLRMTGGISHGYDFSGEQIPYAWDVFGSESWLIELAHASATGQVNELPFSIPPTANGSGFIDEMAWLFVPPPEKLDYWGNNWNSYRTESTEKQTSYYLTEYPSSCLAQNGLFGLSAGEIPSPSTLHSGSVYEAFGVGGRFAPAVDGSRLFDAPIVVPHYAGLTASLQPKDSVQMWNWLIEVGYFSPLTNVESFSFIEISNCGTSSLVWNQLKGSWNLSLQTLGWGRYLAQRDKKTPILWEATTSNPFLKKGYQILLAEVPTATPHPLPMQQVYERECETPDDHTVGQTIERENASEKMAHGQFGATSEHPWPALPGYVKYSNINLPNTDSLFIKLRFSKDSDSSVPIKVFINDEIIPRATIIPENQGNWEGFSWTDPIFLGSVEEGAHTIIFSTEGQQYGTADLDRFILEVWPAPSGEP